MVVYVICFVLYLVYCVASCVLLDRCCLLLGFSWLVWIAVVCVLFAWLNLFWINVIVSVVVGCLLVVFGF